MSDMGDKILPICLTCKSIKIDNKWVGKEVNPDLYESSIKTYEGKLSHSYCPPCMEEYKEKFGIN